MSDLVFGTFSTAFYFSRNFKLNDSDNLVSLSFKHTLTLNNRNKFETGRELTEMHIFKATYSDGTQETFRLNSNLGDMDQVWEYAEKLAKATGEMPGFMRDLTSHVVLNEGKAGPSVAAFAVGNKAYMFTDNFKSNYFEENGIDIHDTFVSDIAAHHATDLANYLVLSQYGEELHSLGGDDTVIGSEVEDQIYGDDGNDKVFGNGGDDFINGGEGDDQLRGGEGDDTISGGEGDDELLGHDGADILNGGAGNDVLFGGRGADHFVFNADDSGYDRIKDFGRGNDTLELSRDLFDGDIDLNALRASHFTKVKGGVEIEISDDLTIFLGGVRYFNEIADHIEFV